MNKAQQASYRFVGRVPETLANGRPVAPGEFFDMTDEDARDPHNESLVHDGKIIGSNDAGDHQVSLAKSRVTRRLKGEAEEVSLETESEQTKEG